MSLGFLGAGALVSRLVRVPSAEDNAGLMDMFVPRIGKHDDTSAYRSLQFHLGDAARLSPVDVLSQVSFEWRDARAASLRIGVAHVNVGVP